MRPIPPRLAVALAAASLLVPSAALGNGFALDIQGVYANGTAGAAAGDPRDPAVQFVNPAALAAIDGTRIAAGGMLVYPRAPYTDAGSTFVGGDRIAGANGDGATVGEVPWVFASQRLGSSVTVGFGLTTPFGLASNYGRDPAFVGRYQGVESAIESIELGPSVGWRLGRGVAVGAAVAARRDHVVQSVALDMNAVCASLFAGGPPTPEASTLCASAPPAGFGLAPGAADGYARFSGDGWSWTTTVGATVEPLEGTTVGLAWRHEMRGSVRGRETFDLPQAATDFFASLNQPDALTGSGAAMDLSLPDFVTLHASHRAGPVNVLAAIQWTRWKGFDAIELVADSQTTGQSFTSVQGYRNALRFALGAEWAVRPGRLDLYGGAAYEQTPVRDAYRQATLPEVDSVILGLGGDVAIAAGLSLAAGWQHVEPTGTARIDQTSALGDRLVGTVRMRADLVLAQLAWRR